VAEVAGGDQDPQLQLDALAAKDCLKTDTATGTKTDRPGWNKCLADLRPGDTFIIGLARSGAQTARFGMREPDDAISWKSAQVRKPATAS
jgi:hypothetical protein